MCSPYAVTLFNKGELCKEESHAASNRNMQRSSPGFSMYSPGNSPKDKTELSLSSSSDSGMFLIRPVSLSSLQDLSEEGFHRDDINVPTTNSLTSFQCNSGACS